MKLVAEVLREALALGIDRLDAQILLSHALQRSRAWLLANGDAALDAAQTRAMDELLRRRAEGEPVAYLLGEKEFHGLRLKVSPAVLIPRADTETLVDWAIEFLLANSNASVLDMGTGSGAIALALKNARPNARLTAIDASSGALAVAAENASSLGLQIETQLSNWWQGLPDQRFDMIVTNPPYIADGDPHLPALRHEPQQALTSGADGLADLRHIIDGAPQHLHPGGWLLLEHGFDQAPSVVAMLAAHGFANITTRSDLAGNPRCTGGRFG